MTAPDCTDSGIRPASADVWDPHRLRELVDGVGEAGVRDLLRLFQADMGFLLGQLSAAIEARNHSAAGHALGTALDAADNLGLGALAAVLRELRSRPPDASFPDLVARELARVRFVPSPKRPS